jgi:hypothetical protein
MKGDWFDGCLPLLELYCEHASYSNQVARELNQQGTVDEHWARLAALHCAQTTALIRAATALRLTPHSHSGARTNRHAYTGPKPWDLIRDEPDDEPPRAS